MNRENLFDNKAILKVKYGRVAERLGRGLQNLVQRFESARDLKELWWIQGSFCFTTFRLLFLFLLQNLYFQVLSIVKPNIHNNVSAWIWFR